MSGGSQLPSSEEPCARPISLEACAREMGASLANLAYLLQSPRLSPVEVPALLEEFLACQRSWQLELQSRGGLLAAHLPALGEEQTRLTQHFAELTQELSRRDIRARDRLSCLLALKRLSQPLFARAKLFALAEELEQEGERELGLPDLLAPVRPPESPAQLTVELISRSPGLSLRFPCGKPAWACLLGSYIRSQVPTGTPRLAALPDGLEWRGSEEPSARAVTAALPSTEAQPDAAETGSPTFQAYQLPCLPQARELGPALLELLRHQGFQARGESLLAWPSCQATTVSFPRPLAPC